MALIVENGTGIADATSLATAAFVTAYLTARGRETENGWSTASSVLQDAACTKGTDHIERSFSGRLKGQKEWQDISQARNTLTIGTNPVNLDTITIGSVVYTFVSSLSSALDVLIGANYIESAANLIGAILADGTKEGVTHGTGTTAHADVAAQSFAGGAVLAYAKVGGLAGNLIASTSSTASMVWLTTTLTGGSDVARPQPLSFPRINLKDREGVIVIGVPEKAQQAVAEYAVRSLADVLAPDPEAGTAGGAIKRKLERTGPIEEETEYVGGTTIGGVLPAYPAADLLMADYINGAVHSNIGIGRVIRG